MPTFLKDDPTTFVARKQGKYRLGAFYVDVTGRVFRFFKTIDSVIVKPGWVVEWASTTKNWVTADRSGGTSLGRIPAGVAVVLVDPAVAPYAFYLVNGTVNNVPNDVGSIGAGINLTTSATVDGFATTAAAYTDNAIGRNRGQNSGALLLNVIDVDL